MAKQITLNASDRTLTGSRKVRLLRRQGKVPGTLYGPKIQPLNIEIKALDLNKILQHATSENLLVDLKLERDGKVENRFALIHDVQHDTLKGSILHVDLHEVAHDAMLRVEVPVETTGEAIGVTTGGGILEHVLRTLHIECLPKDLPDVITVDVSKLQVGQSIHVGDITPPPGVRITSHKDLPVFACVMPKAEEVAAETPATPAGEVEVIGKKAEETESGETSTAEGKKDKEAGKTEAKGGKTEAKK